MGHVRRGRPINAAAVPAAQAQPTFPVPGVTTAANGVIPPVATGGRGSFNPTNPGLDAGSGQQRGAAGRAALNVGMGTNLQDLNVAGLGGVTFDAQGNPQFNADPRTAQAQSLLGDVGNAQLRGAATLTPSLTGTAQQALTAGQGLLQEVMNFDPLAQAEQRFSRLQSILQPDRDRQVASTESRLFAQGRLDSSGGAAQLGEQQRGFDIADTQLLNQLFTEGEQAQVSGTNRALGVSGLGLQAGGGLFQQGIQGATTAPTLSQPLLQLLQTTSGLSAEELNRQIASSNALNNFNISQQEGGGGGAGSALLSGGLAALGSTLGPLGTAAGGAIGKSLANKFF